MSLETTPVIAPNGVAHNHGTRDIKGFGVCPSCDKFHFSQDDFPDWMELVPGPVGLITVAGSHAHGCGTSDSDIDYRGFFITPTRDLFMPFVPNFENFRDSRSDVALHEAKKFVRLAASGNPTALEALASPIVLVSTPFADELRANLDAFLSVKVRAPYIGMIDSMLRTVGQNLGPYISKTPEKGRKAARNAYLLAEQATHLLATGELRIASPDAARCAALAEQPVETIRHEIESWIAEIGDSATCLPAEPDLGIITEIAVQHLATAAGTTVPRVE